MSSQQAAAKAVNVRIDDATAKRILSKLDDLRANSADADRRAHERFSFHKTCLIELTQPSGTVMSIKAPVGDLSRGGMAFLYHGFVHVGTKGRVQLVTTRNSWQFVEGTVVRCEYVEGGIHLVCMQFKHAIDISSFCCNTTPKRILMVDDDAGMRKLVGVHLKQLNVEITEAENGEEAIAAVGAGAFDVILMDIEMPKLDGVAAIKQLRESGYGGNTIALTALSAEGDRERLLQAGFDQYLAKPVTRESLTQALVEIEDEPLFSTMADNEEMLELINQFVDGLAPLVSELEKATAKGETDAMKRIVRSLKGQAGSYGFEPISKLAQDVESLLAADTPPASMAKTTRELIRMCRMARKPS